MTETLKPGYTLVGAQCSVGGVEVDTTVTGATATFTGAAAQPLACTFTNRRAAADRRRQPTVTKTVTSKLQNADGTWTTVYDVAVTNPDASSPMSFTLTDTLDFGRQHRRQPGRRSTGPGASASWNGATDTTVVTGAPLGSRSDRALHRDGERHRPRRGDPR